MLYTAFAGQPTQSGLHRSNAVHRSRGHARFKAEVAEISAEAPLGTLVVRNGDRVLVSNMAHTQLPSIQEMRDALGPLPDAACTDAYEVGLHGVLRACLLARTPELQLSLRNLGLGDLRGALAARDSDEVRRCAGQLVAFMLGIEREHVNQAIERFLSSDEYVNADVSESDSTHFAETEDMEDESREPTQGLKGLLYHIAENDARNRAVERK